MIPKYPVYIPSKGRFDSNLTAKALQKDGVPFHVVVEPQEADSYAKALGDENVLVLPFANLGQGSIPARNWIKQHSITLGHKRHWQIDDNCTGFCRLVGNRRLRCRSGEALSAVETFTDRYSNIDVSGLNYAMFACNPIGKVPNYRLNRYVYSCTLTNNETPFSWRGRYNEDTDYCLQVLVAGRCVVQVNAYLINKTATMTMRGGNTDELYKDDGRLAMARELERRWPGIVETKRRFGRPQHVVKWDIFRQPLIPITEVATNE